MEKEVVDPVDAVDALDGEEDFIHSRQHSAMKIASLGVSERHNSLREAVAVDEEVK